MNTVKVKKSELMNVLKTNRTKHEEDFNKACSVFWDEIRADIDSSLKDINTLLQVKVNTISDLTKLNRDISNKLVPLASFREPEQHLRDYDRAIQMLEMSVEDEIIITAQQFANYVQDEWAWSSSFYSNTKSYSDKFSG